MWSFPIKNDAEEGNSNNITIANEVEPTACELQCKIQQKSLVSCVDSIRAAKTKNNSGDGSSSNDNNNDGSSVPSSTAETPACLPLAIEAWTRCCTDANERARMIEEGQDEANTS